jgi:DNA-binding LacI/PurR family transcriptional regulator
VGGFDDSAVALSTHLPFTTIRQPQERVTEETAHLLLALIDGAEHLDPVILPTDLIVREST